MKIVVTDGFTLPPGALPWDALRELGEVEVYERSLPEQVLERCQRADIVFTNKVLISEALMSELPQLKYIGVLATGYNVVDIAAANRRGIVVTNIPGYGPSSVAQFVFSLILNFAQPVSYYAATVRQQRWSRSEDFCYYDHAMQELEGLVLGIVGFGSIGRRVAAIANGFGMKVLVHSRSQPQDLPDYARVVDLSQLAANSDYISLHCPLTDSNAGFIDAEFLQSMKSSAYLINTGRGPLIDETALAAALENNVIAGAGLDVLAQEPPAQNNLLVSLENCVITPYIAWATVAARQRLMAIAIENLRGFVKGKPVNVIAG